jgi:hypothetical protein
MTDQVHRHEFERLSNSVDGLREEIREMTASVSADTKLILEKIREQNSKVFKLEKEQALYKAGRSETCPNLETIKAFKEHVDYDRIRKSSLDRSLKNTQLTVAIAVAALTILTFFMKYA